MDAGAEVTAASAGRWQRIALATTAAVTVACAARLFGFIDDHAVDLLFSDHWILWDPLFQKADLWTFWRMQHGPQREGLAAWIIAATAQLSGWNLRAEAFVCGAIVVLACVAALALVRAARGRWVISDALVPVIVLTLSQYELLVVTTNPSHGPLPLLLVFALALSLWVEHPRLRLVLLAVTACLSSQTGFAWFLGPIASGLLALMLWNAVRRREDVALHAAALALSVAGLGLFLYELRLDSRGAALPPGVQFPHPDPVRYVVGNAYFFLAALRIPEFLETAALAAGFAAAGGCVALAAWSGWRTVQTVGASRLHATVFVLSGFTLLFAVTAVIGRVPLGVGSLTASRYAPYAIPLVIAAYLLLSAGEASRRRLALLAAFAALCVTRELMTNSTSSAQGFAARKRAFQACYLETLNADWCGTVIPLYADPRETQMGAKLHYLREHRLSFFRP